MGRATLTCQTDMWGDGLAWSWGRTQLTRLSRCVPEHVCTAGKLIPSPRKGKAGLAPPSLDSVCGLEHSTGTQGHQVLILAVLITAGHMCQPPPRGQAHAACAQLQQLLRHRLQRSQADGHHKAPPSPPLSSPCPARGQLKGLPLV